MYLSQARATLLKPRNALMAGAAVYGLLVFYMSTRYYQTSPMKQVFHNASEEWDKVEIMRPK
jgi:hypothetical protein